MRLPAFVKGYGDPNVAVRGQAGASMSVLTGGRKARRSHGWAPYLWLAAVVVAMFVGAAAVIATL